MELWVSVSESHLSIKQVERLFTQAENNGEVSEYAKFGKVKARQATPGETVKTVIDGKVETTNKATDGDYVVTGPKGEEYIIDGVKFNKRYSKISDGLYKPLGTCFAFKYSGPSFTFDVSWGERMLCDKGDYIASINEDGTDPYRIEHEIFLKTYKEK